MRYALYAEWTKLRTLPGTPVFLLAAIAGMVGVSAAAAACSGPGCEADLPKLSLTGVQLGQAVVAILAVRVMGDEYSSGLVTVTLAAMPRRGRVLAAKAVVVAAVVAVASAVAVAGCLVVGRLLLPAHDPTLRPAFGTVLYLVLVGLLCLGTATAVRNPPAAIGIVLALLYALPLITGVVTDPDRHRHLQQIGPASAGLAVQATTSDPVIGPWQGLGVLALWAFGALLAGGTVLHRRDA